MRARDAVCAAHAARAASASSISWGCTLRCHRCGPLRRGVVRGAFRDASAGIGLRSACRPLSPKQVPALRASSTRKLNRSLASPGAHRFRAAAQRRGGRDKKKSPLSQPQRACKSAVRTATVERTCPVLSLACAPPRAAPDPLRAHRDATMDVGPPPKKKSKSNRSGRPLGKSRIAMHETSRAGAERNAERALSANERPSANGSPPLKRRRRDRPDRRGGAAADGRRSSALGVGTLRTVAGP